MPLFKISKDVMFGVDYLINFYLTHSYIDLLNRVEL